MTIDNDYGRAATITKNTISDILNQIKADEIAEKGGTVLEVANAITADVDWDLMGKTMNIVLFIKNYADMAGIDVIKMPVMDGFALTARGYVEHPLAVELGAFTQESGDKTVSDLLDFIGSKEPTPVSGQMMLYRIEQMDVPWFIQNICPLSIYEGRRRMALNKEQSDKKHAKEIRDLTDTQAAATVLDMPFKEYKAQQTANKEKP